MEANQSHQFNERLSQWVAAQGFWFQVRHSMTGSGGKGKALYHLVLMGFRLSLLLLVVAAGLGFYLVKRTSTKSFQKNLNVSLKSGLTASEAEIFGPVKKGNDLWLNRMVAKGGDQTFFNCLEAKNIRFRMGALAGVVGKWDTGTVSVSRLEMELRAGADDDASAQMIANSLFKKYDDVDFNSLEIREVSLFWGYSARTRGTIENSSLVARRVQDGWKLNFKGGTFSQSWLNQLEIIELAAFCSPQGILFEKAEFRRGNGTIDLSGLKLTGGARPTLEGIAKIRELSLENILSPHQREFIEGSISGDFKVSGSTNSIEGIGFSGKVSLDTKDTIALKDQIPLLRALSVVDYSRDYRRTTFVQGSFQLKTMNGGMELSEIQLKTNQELDDQKQKIGESLILDGKLIVRMPTPEETRARKEDEILTEKTSQLTDVTAALENTHLDSEEADLMLEKVAQNTKKAKSDAPDSLTNRIGASLTAIKLDGELAEKLSKQLHYEGEFQISLLPNAFERAPELIKTFPLDSASGRIPIVVSVNDGLEKITSKQAEQIYQKGRR